MSPGILIPRPGGVQAERINGDVAVRLTLRTLLAYLDDILPAAETKELGEKIAASPVASQLVERIRDVMRRRRLTAPEVDGSGGGIEPNLVAEYLDNSLPPERVADVERVCLESDVNLAEVAACHQVLTLVLGEPVEIAGRLRERMYALGPQGTPLEVPEPPSASKNVRETNAREQLAAIQAAQKTGPRGKSVAKPAATPSRVPDYLKRPLWQRVLPWMIVPALVLAYLGLLWIDPSLFPGGHKKEVASEKTEPAKVAAKDRAEPKPSPAPAETEEPVPAVAAAETDSLDLPVDPEPPADAAPVANTEPQPGPAEPSPMPPSEAVAVTPTVAAAPTPAPTPAPSPAAEAATPETAPQIDVFSTDGVVLRYDAGTSQWFPLKADEDPPAGAAVAVPDPFRAELTLAGLPLRIAALGGTRLAPVGKTEAADAGLDLAEGRIRIAGDTAAAGPAAAAKMMFALRLGRGLWRVEPLTPETVVGIEALPLQPSGEDQDRSGRTPQGVVYVAAGAVRVVQSGRVEVASAGNRLILTPSEVTGDMPPAGDPGAEAPADAAAAPADDEPTPDPPAADEAETAAAETAADAVPDAAAETAGSVEPLPPLGLPEWITPREPTAAARRGMTAFKAEFVPDAPAVASLLPAVRNRNFNIAEPAAKALGLIENVDALVRTLRDTEHREATLAAVDGLRNWLGRHPDGDYLRQQLEATFDREGLADTLYRLLWGYSAEDARDQPTAEQLVDWLAHPEPVVREIAFYHVKRLSGRTLNYNPLATEGQRAGPLNQWRAFVARHGGLVVND